MNRKAELKILIYECRKYLYTIANNVCGMSKNSPNDKSWIHDLKESTEILENYISEYNSL